MFSKTPLALLALVAAVWAPAAVAQTGVSGPGSRTWSVSADYQGTFTDNAQFSSPVGSGDIVNRVGGSLAYTRISDRSQLAFTGQGAMLLYGRLSDLNTYTYGVDFAGDVELSPRASLSFGQFLSRDYSTFSGLLTQQAVVLPLVVTTTAGADVGLSYALSPKTSVSGSFSYEYVAFDEPTLQGGSVYSAGAQLSRQLSLSDSLSASYGFQRSVVVGQELDSHTVGGGWQRVVSPRLSFNASGGFTRSRRLGSSDAFYTLYASGGLTAAVGRGSLSADYSRSVRQAFGLGTNRLADVVTTAFSYPLGQRLSIGASAVYGYSRVLDDVELRYHTVSTSANVGFQLTQDLSLAGSYAYRRLDQVGATFPLTSNSVSFSISYGHVWQ